MSDTNSYIIRYTQIFLGKELVDSVIKTDRTEEEIQESVSAISSDPHVIDVKVIPLNDLTKYSESPTDVFILGLKLNGIITKYSSDVFTNYTDAISATPYMSSGSGGKWVVLKYGRPTPYVSVEDYIKD